MIYISCEGFMLLKTDLIKTNKNDTIPFQKLTKKSHGKGFKGLLRSSL